MEGTTGEQKAGTPAAPVLQGHQEPDPVSAPVAHSVETPLSDGKELSDSTLEDGDFFEPGPLARQPTKYESIVHDDDQAELAQIAKAISRRQSTVRAGQGMSILTPENPALDPASPKFNIWKWAQHFIQGLSDEGVTIPRTGVIFKDLNVYGSGDALQMQDTVWSLLTSVLRPGDLFSFGKKEHRHILHNFDGLLKSGEMLVVLGTPGSGCSTLLKSLCGELNGLTLGDESRIHYQGISQAQAKKEFKGEFIYNQEVDKHFPHLQVGQTIEYAASVRTPQHRIESMSRKDYCKYIAQVTMAVCGLTHTYNTKVGNDFVRGVSGGERKRVSIAEMMVAGAMFSAWDNSTRGLDSATALKFVQTLRMSSDLGGHTNAVAIYQASQAIYDTFDKAAVLYKGRQIYFGPAVAAKSFFERQGWECPSRQTTGDFLTSVTNPQERQPRDGMEGKVPRTPEEFEQYWRESPEYKALRKEIDDSEAEEDGKNQKITELREHKNFVQANHVRPKSPYRISAWMQIKANTKRAYQRTWNDISAAMTQAIVNMVMALIIGSIFYGTPNATAGFYAKGSVLFMAILLNALNSISEISSQYAQRPIVAKHHSYAFYHPWTEAAAGIVADIPIKFIIATFFNVLIYFMSGLRREPAQFFLFFLITYISTFVMSAVFRTLAAITRTVSQAMTLAGIMVLALVIYTGFVITVPDMHPWFSWIRWINPIFYAFEILVANEFHGQRFTCSSIIPPYTPLIGTSWICDSVGAQPGQDYVSGDAFIALNYEYYYSHVWRNFGILLAFLVGFSIMYLAAIEINSETTSTAEALVFPRNKVPAYLKKGKGSSQGAPVADEEKGVSGTTDAENFRERDGEDDGNSGLGAIEAQHDIFTWRDVVYDIKIKGEPRRLLDNVAGWVKPGTLTALMGVSGAGKTTLLDVLAQRTSMGVITGDMLVNGKPLDASFQRKTGYVQQQDLHLETATVRESLQFSAMLRQPKSVSKQEKYDFVEEVIKMLKMEEFANAVVGVPGEGLNVEQRKLLTIGVELVARPKLLLFLDEPTSGLDSQSSWAICAFLRKLANSGQAILCTIHQPSAILFQEFDRLLFLAKGGKTVYFGDIGKNSRTLLDYFESNGAERPCGDSENPAEYMLEIVNAGSNSRGEDWHGVWNASEERNAVNAEIDRIHAEKQNAAGNTSMEPQETDKEDAAAQSEFAMPFTSQISYVTGRVFQQYWRMPSYIMAKFALGIAAGLFIGFTFYRANSSQAGMQTVVFAVFMVTTIFTTLVQQIQPLFITQRELYEVRERPSKAYSWKAFLIANIVVEFPFQIVTGILIYACFYFPVLGANQSPERQGLVLLFIIQLFLYASAFAHMTVAAMPDAVAAGGIVTFLTMMSILFNGVLQTPTALPGFWIFMYRVSPFTYWVSGIVSTALHGREVICSTSETATFDPPQGQTCGDYLKPFTSKAPGILQNPLATSDCHYCSLQTGDQYLAGSSIYWSERWRNFGIVWAYIIFNIAMAVLVYYVFRVRKSRGEGSGSGGLLGKLKGLFAKKQNKDQEGQDKKSKTEYAAGQ